MENFWKSNSFDEIFKLTFDRTYREFDQEWTYALKKKYYPLLGSLDQPSAVSRPIVSEGFNSKPVWYHHGNRKELYFIGNHTGYTSIFKVSVDSGAGGGADRHPSTVIEGEKSDEFEAFHIFQSKLDISRD